MPNKAKSLDERLNIYTTQVLPSGCVIWTGYVDRDGYSIACMVGSDGKKNRKVHRLVYEQQHGRIPSGLMVCHRCDIRSCVNPDHLFLGTAKDNVADMWAKGRWKPGAQDNRGERNPRARLTSDDVQAIRSKRASGIGSTRLAEVYDISRSHVQRICSGQMWAEAALIALYGKETMK